MVIHFLRLSVDDRTIGLVGTKSFCGMVAHGRIQQLNVPIVPIHPSIVDGFLERLSHTVSHLID